MPLTPEQRNQRRQDAELFITENAVNSCDIKTFVQTYFHHERDDIDFYAVLPVKDYIDKKTGETKKLGTKSSLTLDEFYELETTEKIAGRGKDGEDWTCPVKSTDAEYWEIRPCLNNKGQVMAIIDIDGWKSGGDVGINELFAVPEFPEELSEASFFLSRTKSLPHFVVWIEGFPSTIELKQYIGVLKDFQGDILFNHAWERVDNRLYNIAENEDGCGLLTLQWETVKTWISTDPENKHAQKLLKTKKEKKEKKSKESKSKEENTASGFVSEKYGAICDEIRRVVGAILKLKPEYFDGYAEWSQLGYICSNETEASDDGAELFRELSGMLSSPGTDNAIYKQYNATQKTRKKEDKLTVSALYRWLKELDPKNPVLKENELRLLASGKLTLEELRETAPYIADREKFEATNFKLNNPLRYCEQFNDSRRGKGLILRSVIDFKERFRDSVLPNYEYTNPKNGAKIPVSFIQVWLDDPKKRKYSRIKFDPTNKTETEDGEDPQFNAFCGWINDIGADPIEEDKSDFLKLLKWLVLEPKVYEYLKCWFAHIIQHPDKKTLVAPVLYSKTHGTGKNSVVDGFISILGRELCAMVESIEDITKNFNAHLCNRLLIYGDEISANAKKVSDKLKAVITRPTTNLEKKNVDAIEVDDLTNWIFTSNNENNLKVEEGDRRFVMCHCREEKQNHLSRASYEEINDPLKVARLFAFFKKYQQSEQSIKDFQRFNIGSDNAITTDYKNRMIYEHRPAYIQILFKGYRDLIGQKFSSSKLHSFTQEWAKKNHLSSNYTVQEFAKHSKPFIEVFKVKGELCNYYQFPHTKQQLLEQMFNADPAYYRYINQLEDDFNPDFTVPEKPSVWQGGDIEM